MKKNISLAAFSSKTKLLTCTVHEPKTTETDQCHSVVLQVNSILIYCILCDSWNTLFILSCVGFIPLSLVPSLHVGVYSLHFSTQTQRVCSLRLRINTMCSLWLYLYSVFSYIKEDEKCLKVSSTCEKCPWVQILFFTSELQERKIIVYLGNCPNPFLYSSDGL